MIELNALAEEIYDAIDRGCGCCTFTGRGENLDRIKEILAVALVVAIFPEGTT